MTVEANAKVNFTLEVFGKRADGYHALRSVVMPISFSDTLDIEVTDDGSITSDTGYDDDLCVKAARILRSSVSGLPSSFGVTVRVTKRIPAGGGLGGGSADAAAVLAALMEAFPGKVGEKELYEIALKVGADVPFCLAGGTRLCQNVGEIMTVLPAFDAYVVIAKPDAGVSTKAAYGRFDAEKDIPHPDDASFLFYAASGEYKEAMKYAGNIFETLVPLREGAEIKDKLYANGAYYAAMSGSGSAYFGVFDREEDAVKAAANLRKTVPFAEVFHTAE